MKCPILLPFACLACLVSITSVACNGAISPPQTQTQSPEASTADAPADDLAADASLSPWPWLAASDDAPPPVPAEEAESPPPLPVQAPPSPLPSDDGGCAGPAGPGDLAIDELMIASVAGTGDYGEWFEVKNVSVCAINLRGLHGDCASGSKVRTFDVGEDLWIPANGTFLVADSPNPAQNHSLPVPVLVWSGAPGDVLRNKGATIVLSVSGTVVDTLTYPALKLTVGASVAFPADCDPSVRSDWTAWQTSSSSFFPGFYGTPNAENTDVSCPLAPGDQGLAEAGP